MLSDQEWAAYASEICDERYVKRQLEALVAITSAIGYADVPFDIFVFTSKKDAPVLTNLSGKQLKQQGSIQTNESGMVTSVTIGGNKCGVQKEVLIHDDLMYHILTTHKKEVYNVQDAIGFERENVLVDGQTWYARVRFVCIPKYFKPGFFPITTELQNVGRPDVVETRTLLAFPQLPNTSTSPGSVEFKNQFCKEEGNYQKAFNLVTFRSHSHYTRAQRNS